MINSMKARSKGNPLMMLGLVLTTVSGPQVVIFGIFLLAAIMAVPMDYLLRLLHVAPGLTPVNVSQYQPTILLLLGGFIVACALLAIGLFLSQRAQKR